MQVLMELGRTTTLGISSISDEDQMYMGTRETLTEAMKLADLSESNRSEAILRILMVEAFLAGTHVEQHVTKTPFYLERETEASRLCAWIIEHESRGISDDLRSRAKELQRQVKGICQEMERQERIAVRRAIDASFIPLADGGSNARWYVCPKGHEYFIGECGMPMQEARCIECGLPVGGRNHAFVEGNQQSRRD